MQVLHRHIPRLALYLVATRTGRVSDEVDEGGLEKTRVGFVGFVFLGVSIAVHRACVDMVGKRRTSKKAFGRARAADVVCSHVRPPREPDVSASDASVGCNPTDRRAPGAGGAVAELRVEPSPL